MRPWTTTKSPLQAALSQAGNVMCVLKVCKHRCPCLLSDVDNVSTTKFEKKQHAIQETQCMEGKEAKKGKLSSSVATTR